MTTTLADPTTVDRSHSEVRALARALRTPRSTVDWNEEQWQSRSRLAVEHRVGPLLHLAQREAGISSPGDAARILRDDYYRSAASNLIRFHELSRMISAWPRPARVLVLKGAALANDLYDDPASRPMSDLDLLVDDADFDVCLSELTRLGYREAVPEMAAGLEKSSRFQVSMVGGPRGRVIVELHRSIVAGQSDSRAPELSWLWRHTEPLQSDVALPTGTVACQLSPTANLIYLAAHAMLQHAPEELRLVWLVDIDRLIRRRGEEIDWTEAVAAAARFGWRDALQSALELTIEWLQTPTPWRLNPSPVDHGEGLSTGWAKDVSGLDRGTRVWRELARLEWPERTRLVMAILLPSTSYVRWRYPQFGAWWLLGYPFRWSKVCSMAGRAILGWLSRKGEKLLTARIAGPVRPRRGQSDARLDRREKTPRLVQRFR